jgi:DNA-binding MarR family transcriptional regulator
MTDALAASAATIGSECFCLNIRRTARAVARRYDDALRPVDLTNGQFSTLVAIAALQSAPMQALAEQLGMDRTTLTAMLKPLRRRGLVSVRHDAGDRRSRRLALTEKGSGVLHEAIPLWRKLQHAVARDAGVSNASALRAQLARLA